MISKRKSLRIDGITEESGEDVKTACKTINESENKNKPLP